MIISFYRIMGGFLKVLFYGDFKERALSVCAQNGIAVWGTKLKDEKIECFISVKDFRILRKIGKGKGFRVHILKKIGFPFVVSRYRHRYGIIAGAIIIFSVLQLMTGYIWIIDIKGNEKIKTKAVISACESIGIYEGIRKSTIYPKAEREKLMLKLDGVAWCSINIEGSRLSINITESEEKANKEESFNNLKASADGIIEKMDIVSGTSEVNVGQAGKKGDLLVSGIVETADGTRFVNAKGTVTAKSQTELKFTEKFSQVYTYPTGKIKIKKVLELYGIKAPLYLGEEHGKYNVTQKTECLKLFGCNLPIRLHSKSFVLKKDERVNLSYEKLCERLEKRLKKETDAKILSKEFSSNKKGVTLTAIVEKNENIAVSEKILINTGN